MGDCIKKNVEAVNIENIIEKYSLNKEILDRFNKLIYEINKLASNREYETIMNVISNIIISYNSSLLTITNINELLTELNNLMNFAQSKKNLKYNDKCNDKCND